MLAGVFLKGFREAIGLATAAALPYLALNLVVLGAAPWEVMTHPALLADWRSALAAKGDFTLLVAGALLVFPKLALGLSGFETGVTVMPLIDGGDADREHNPRTGEAPRGRVANTRKLLLTAAAIMSVLLVLSSFVTTLLIEPADYQEGGKAAGRAIAFLAHKYLGSVFGTVYDASTILILGLAGASAMAGLLNLIPRYLPRFGMAPRWASLSRPLVLVLFAVDVVVTWVFDADVEAQSGAYATGVLVLILSAAFATTLGLWRERRRGLALGSGMICSRVRLHPGRQLRGAPRRADHRQHLHAPPDAGERSQPLHPLRGASHPARVLHRRRELADGAGDQRARRCHLVPIQSSSAEARRQKRAEIARHYNVRGPFLFLHVNLLDNRSEFQAPLEVTLRKDGDDYVGEVFGAIAIANTIAYVSEAIDPISIFIGLTRRGLMAQAARYLLFGEGETGLMVYTILLRYWDWTPEDDVRPRIFLMSD